jgi:hypothetical protein
VAKIIRRETRKRGFFGWIFKALFIIFNLVMLVWLISYWSTVGGMMNTATSDAARTGGALGATLGTGVLALLWVAGAVVLGLFTMLTRGKLTVIEERVEG